MSNLLRNNEKSFLMMTHDTDTMKCVLLGQWEKMPEVLGVPKNRLSSHNMKICFNRRTFFFLNETTTHHKPLRVLPAVRLTTEAVPAVMASTWEWISCLDSSTLFWTHTLDACKTRQLCDTIIAQNNLGNQRSCARKWDQYFGYTLLTGPAPRRPLNRLKQWP